MYENYYQCFDGKVSKKVVGYCWKHRKFVTIKQINARKCLSRECSAIRKLPVAYWERKRESRKLAAAKAKVKEYEYAGKLK